MNYLQHYLDETIYYTPGQIGLVCNKYFEEKKVKSKKKYEKEYYNSPLAFDIETSSFYESGEKRAIMYEWTLGICGGVIIGRTWEEFINTINYLVDRYSTSLTNIMVIYVHNLAFEFQFIRKLFDWDQVFALDERKTVYARTKQGIEFRCSYILSNASLATVGKNLTKYKCKKMTGDLDYELIRHSRTPLTEEEVKYCINDVKVVMAYIQEKIEQDGGINNIPLTNTGYVRRYCRSQCMNKENSKKYRQLMLQLQLTKDDYEQAKRAFQGGFTHADALYSGELLENVSSDDETSAYPAVMVAEQYPMSKFHKKEIKSLKELDLFMEKCCCMFDVEFTNLNGIKPEHPLSSSHCYVKKGIKENNGRVVSADMVRTSVTEVDYKLYKEYYKWDNVSIANFKYAYKNYLPTPFVKAVLELFQKKTVLKGNKEEIVEYMQSKGMLNSSFGMMVTDIMRDEILYTENEWTAEEVNCEETIEKYNKSWNRFLYYPWGVWVTAYARRNLFTAITEFGDDYVYADTDSIKGLNRERHANYFIEYNKELELKLKKALDYHNLPYELVTPKTQSGRISLLGSWDYEGTYDKFKTLGAKRYMVEKNGEIEITVAGVSKKTGSKYMESLENPFHEFSDDLVIPEDHTGKLTHTYIDKETEGTVVDYLGEEEDYVEQSGVHLEKASYSLSISKQYFDYIIGIKDNQKR